MLEAGGGEVRKHRPCLLGHTVVSSICLGSVTCLDRASFASACTSLLMYLCLSACVRLCLCVCLCASDCVPVSLHAAVGDITNSSRLCFACYQIMNVNSLKAQAAQDSRHTDFSVMQLALGELETLMSA